MKREVAKDPREDPLRLGRREQLGRGLPLTLLRGRVGRHVPAQGEETSHCDIVLTNELEDEGGGIGEHDEVSQYDAADQEEAERVERVDADFLGWCRRDNRCCCGC